MNLFRYVDQYGGATFEEVPFGEVDNAVFSSLAYINLEGLVSRKINVKKTIQEVGNFYFETKYVKGDKKNILAVREAVKLLKYIKDTKRYGNLLLSGYVYETGEEKQFAALTIEIHSKLVYVSFEGTDHLISGWKEDFMLSYQFPVLSQKRAIDYVNKNFLLSRKRVVLGGHSKGGNLAMAAGMYANFLVRNKIIRIYNNDGPGLLLEQITSKNYQRIQEKIVHIVPNYSVVGLLLRHANQMVVVRSFRKSIFAHDLFTWVVDDRTFERAELSNFSKRFDEGLIQWLVKYDREARKKFVMSLFEIFNRANIRSVIDILENKRLIFQLISEVNGVDASTRMILKDFVYYLFQCFKDVKIEELKSLFEKK